MALDKADSISQINNLFPDNTTGEISPADQRVVNINAISSNLNLVDPGLQVVTGSASLSTKQIGVNSIDHFPTPAGGVITLAADTVYYVGNDIDFGTNRIVLNDETVIIGLDDRLVTLTYSGTGSMFTSVNAGFRLRLLSISCASGTFLTASDTGSKIFCFNDLNITACTNLGTLTGYEFFDIHHCNFVASTSGFIFAGAIDEFHSHNSTFNMSAGKAIDLDTATFNSVDVDDCSFTLASGSFGVSGLASSGNINAGGLGKIRFSKFSGAGTPLENISIDDARWNFSGNDDIADSRPDGLLSMIDNTVETVISTIGVGVLVAGIWVMVTASQFTTTAAGRLTYDGGRPAKLPVTVSTAADVASGTNQEIRFHLYLNGVIIEESKTESNIDAGDIKNQSNIWQLTMEPGDYLELFVENNSTTNNIIVVDAKFRIN